MLFKFFLNFLKIPIFSISLLLYIFYTKYILNYNHKSFYHKYNNFLVNKIFQTNIKVKNSIPKLTKPHIIMSNHYNATDLTIIKKSLGLHLYTIAKSDLLASENTVVPFLNYFEKTFLDAFCIIPYVRDNKKSGDDVKKKFYKK